MRRVHIYYVGLVGQNRGREGEEKKEKGKDKRGHGECNCVLVPVRDKILFCFGSRERTVVFFFLLFQ